MRRGGWARPTVLIITMLLCYGMSTNISASLPKSGGATLYLPSGSYSYRALEKDEQRAAQPVAFAAWNQLDGQSVTNAELERARTVGVMTIYGDSTQPLPQLPMLLPGSSGCLLDTDSCYALFGDFSPIGGVVEVDGTEYVITGVFDYPAGMLVRQGKTEGDTNRNRITLSLAGVPDPDRAAEEFAMRHGLAPYGVLSQDSWSGLAGVFSHLLPLLILVSVLFYGLRYAFRRRATPVLAGLSLLFTAAAAALLWVLCGLSFTVPLSLTPSRWSDFEFWSAALADIKSQLWLLLTLPRELPQAMPMILAFRCVFWGGAAALLYPQCIKALRSI